MDPSVFDPAAFSGRVPIFPLSNVVLFPQAYLPLHIFEPRYRAMTADALEGEGLIAMAMFLPGWEKEYYGNPPVRQVVGIGRIVQHEKQADGRYNLVLHGVARAKILGEVSQEPYRTARVEVLRDRPEKGEKYERLRRLLLQFYTELLKGAVDGVPAAPPEDVSLGELCDLVAAILRLEAPVKQDLLEALEVGSRCDRLVSLLQTSESAAAPEPSPWPPPPSSN